MTIAFALHALQAGFDDGPLGAVDHHRHVGDVGVAGDQAQELRHRRFAVEQGVVHVDVDDGRAAGDLLAGDFDGFLELAVADQPGERLAAGDVRPLADHDEVAVGPQRERAACRESRSQCGCVARLMRLGRACTRSAIAAMCAGVVPQQPPTMFSQPCSANSPSSAAICGRAEVVLPHLVGQAGVGIGNWIARRRDLGQLLEVRPHRLGPEGAVHADGQQREVWRARSRTPRPIWPETNVAPPWPNVPRGHHRERGRRARRSTSRWRTGRP